MKLVMGIMLLLSASSSWAVELEMDHKVTDGRMIYLLLHDQIDNFRTPDCIRDALSQRYQQEVLAFTAAGCRFDSIQARPDGTTTPDGKAYLKVELGTKCPNQGSVWPAEVLLVESCVLK